MRGRDGGSLWSLRWPCRAISAFRDRPHSGHALVRLMYSSMEAWRLCTVGELITNDDCCNCEAEAESPPSI